MDHDYLLRLKQTHPTLRLLAADNAPLIISFLHQVFVRPNQRSLCYSDLLSSLEDYLFQLHSLYGDELYPRSAKQYMTDWSDERTPFLRKYYTDLDDEPEFDLTPETEKAIEWIQSLQEREFVGTESRLLTVFQLLREITHNTEQDPEARIRDLEQQQAEIEAEIARVRSGRMAFLDQTQVRERFFQVEDTARKLLGDFRQVEHNFRRLDRQTRERIATSDRPKGKMLDEVFAEQDLIRDSDQGRSFRAFWEFLMSPQRQSELDELLEHVLALPALCGAHLDPFLRRIKFYLLEAGDKVHQTNNLLVEQLRRYLDDQAWLENKRIMELIKGIEKHAVEAKDHASMDARFTELSDFKPTVELVMSRALFTPPHNPVIASVDLTEGDVAVDVAALFQQTYVDEAELAANVRRALQTQSQISLAHLVRRNPITKGLAEVVGYLNLAARDEKALIDPDNEETLEYEDHQSQRKRVRMPQVIFVR